MNGKAINCNSSGPRIPGLVDDHPLEGRLTERRIQRKNFPGKESNSKEEPAVTSYSSEFFLLDKFQSDLELLNDVSNQTFRNFLVRPKSSGARLYGVRPGNGNRLDTFNGTQFFNLIPISHVNVCVYT